LAVKPPTPTRGCRNTLARQLVVGHVAGAVKLLSFALSAQRIAALH
jgi:hypothetical protein